MATTFSIIYYSARLLRFHSIRIHTNRNSFHLRPLRHRVSSQMYLTTEVQFQLIGTLIQRSTRTEDRQLLTVIT